MMQVTVNPYVAEHVQVVDAASNDIGSTIATSRVSLSSLSVQDKLYLMKHRWQLDKDAGWPFSERKHSANIRRKYLKSQHISGKYLCYSYSAIEKGLFCVPCVLFGARSVGGVSLQKLIRSALQNTFT